MLEGLSAHYGFSRTSPFGNLPARGRDSRRGGRRGGGCWRGGAKEGGAGRPGGGGGGGRARPPLHRGCPRVLRRPVPPGAGRADRGTDLKRDSVAPFLPRERGARLPLPRPRLLLPVGRGWTKDPAGHPDRLAADV